MIISPFNNVLVAIDQKFIAEVTNAIRMANLNNGSQINPADFVQIIGTIVSVPKMISERHDYKGFSVKDLKVGDKAIFSYTVIFSFIEGEDGNATYKNVFWYKGKDYWKVDIQSLYAVIRDGNIIMVNGYCMVQDWSAPSAIILPNSEKKKLRASTAVLTQINNNLQGQQRIEAQAGDIVHYNPSKLIEYSINGKKFGILRQKDILAIEVGDYSFLN